MSISKQMGDREYQKFREDSSGKPAIAVVNSDGSAINAGRLVSDNFDYVGASYPDTVTETYTYKTGGASGTTVAIVTVVYTTSTKDVLTSVTRS